ncbi:MAG: hypothetical protein NVS9B5_34300 [Terriglobales bacterium]
MSPPATTKNAIAITETLNKQSVEFGLRLLDIQSSNVGAWRKAGADPSPRCDLTPNFQQQYNAGNSFYEPDEGVANEGA